MIVDRFLPSLFGETDLGVVCFGLRETDFASHLECTSIFSDLV
jgi:hypothetical protein